MSRRAGSKLRGPGSATGVGAPDLRAWWAKSPPPPDLAVAAHAPAVERDEAQLGALAIVAAALQSAADEHELFEAVAAAVALRGLSGHLALLDPSGAFLVVRAAMLPWAHQAELERMHGGPMVGTRIDLGSGTAHGSVVHGQSSMHAPEPLDWVLGAALGTTPTEADAIAAFVGLGEALLVPVTNGRDVFGVLTVWARALTRADRALCEILGRLTGGALSEQRTGEPARPATPALVA